MTELDQLLTDTFERRAALAPTAALSPAALRKSVRDDRVRRGVRGLTALTAIATVAGAFLLGQHEAGSGRPAQVGAASSTPTATPTAAASVLASLPWADGQQLTLRLGTGVAPAGHAAFCIPDSCSGAADLTGSLDFHEAFGGLVGTAPVGTAKVRVTATGSPAVTVPVVPVWRSGIEQAVLFGTPLVTARLGTDQRLTRTLLVQALDDKGHAVTQRRSLGSRDLAVEHPPVGGVRSLPAGSTSPLLWSSHGGWVCLGYRAAVGTTSEEYGAAVCYQPGPGPELLAETLDQPDSAVLVSLPANAVSGTLQTPGGVVRATVLSAGADRFALFSPTDSARASGMSTLVLLDGQGRQVFNGHLDSVPFGKGVTQGAP